MEKSEFEKQFEIRKELNAGHRFFLVGIELLSEDVVWAKYYEFAKNEHPEDFIYFSVDGNDESIEYIAKIKLSSIKRIC